MSMKYCIKGDHTVSTDNFSNWSRAKDGLQTWCKACTSAYAKERYKKGDRARIERNSAAALSRNRDYVWDLLVRSVCIDCGNSDPRVLTFDHLEPSEKSNNISGMMYHFGLDSIKAEIAKCVIRCSNCHIIRTNYQFGLWRSLRYDEDLTTGA